MANVALTCLMATVEIEFLQHNPRVSLDDDDDYAAIKSLFERLSFFKPFLEKPNGRRAAKTRDSEIKIRDFALKVEDEIETLLHNLLSDKTEDQEMILWQLRQTVREAEEKAAELMKIINNKEEEEDDDATENQRLMLIHNSPVESSLFPPPMPKHKLVGPDNYGMYHTGAYVSLMCDLFTETVTLVTILGMVGIGKTILAARLYLHPEVMSRFTVRVWITLPRKHETRQLLFDLLRSITQREPNETQKESTLDELAEQVREHLSGKRYLIVLDNLCDFRGWDYIKRRLPDDKNGSRVMVTTSHFNWSSLQMAVNDYVCNVELLDQNHSWDLFCDLLSHKAYKASHLERIKSSVVEKCDGLPQLIINVAKRLSKFDNIKRGWKKIEKELETLGILDRNALTYSYNPLPHELKSCFLYLGVFPKRSLIPVKVLVRLWMAEGFVGVSENAGYLEDKAYADLQELIDRSLVMIHAKSPDGIRIKTVRMHSALHTFCVREAQKETIFNAVDTQKHPRLSPNDFANSCRWLSVYAHSFDYYVLFNTNNPRSVFLFQEIQDRLVPTKLLRVLAFDPSQSLFQTTPIHSRDLVFLRYISVRQWFEGLDRILSTNPNLQTLIVSRDNRSLPTRHLGSRIWESRKLTHLEVSCSISVDPPGLDNPGLQTLYWLRLDDCTEDVMSRIPNVKRLGIVCDRSPANHRNLDNLRSLTKLDTLKISSGLRNLSSLQSYQNIRKLNLKRTSLAWSEINRIGMLPKLQVLKLKEASNDSIWENFDWDEDFFSLKFLLIEARNLVHWRIYEEEQIHFRCLKHLVLKKCVNLQDIPDGILGNLVLESVVVQNCSASVSAYARC